MNLQDLGLHLLHCKGMALLFLLICLLVIIDLVPFVMDNTNSSESRREGLGQIVVMLQETEHEVVCHCLIDRKSVV